MSSSMKFSLLALVGAATAVPYYGHSKFHHKPSEAGVGYAGPTGGWGVHNTTAAAGPTGTGYAPGPGGDEQTTTTSTIKSTITQTLYVSAVPSSDATSVGAVDVSTGNAVCGPATVTVTATNKVTVTVPAGGAAAPSAEVPSAEAPVPNAPGTSSGTVVEAGKPTGYPTKPATTQLAPVPSVSKESSAYVAPVPAPSKETAAPAKPTTEVPSVKPTTEVPSVKPTTEVPSVKPTTEVPSVTEPVETSKSSSSTSAAKPTNAPSSGGKRGLLYRWDGAADAKGFTSVGSFGWVSNWEDSPKGDIGNAEFIPTLRSLDRSGSWSAAIDTAVAGGSKTVFTFNEPDMGGQANLGVDAACSAWKEHVAPLVSKHSGVNFVGPSVSSSVSDNQGLDWLSKFQSNCPEAVWSTANFHWYGSPADGFDAFKAHIDNSYKTIGKDFYVTEFALNNASGEDSATFLGKAQEYLDSHPNCLGYSYFAVGAWSPDYGMTSDNLLGTAEALTPAGKVYVGA